MRSTAFRTLFPTNAIRNNNFLVSSALRKTSLRGNSVAVAAAPANNNFYFFSASEGTTTTTSDGGSTTSGGSGSSTTTTTGTDSSSTTTTASSTTTTTQPPPTEEIIAIKEMRPRQLMSELDKFIVGQSDAKRAVAVALRNRWRRHQVQDAALRDEITPKNILMIGPTGVGKTEIARRLAKLTDAPFIKVEATKFTEVGFHGRDVDSIIEDLYKVALTNAKQVLMRKNEAQAKERAEERILHALAGSANEFRDHLRSGDLDHLEVTLDLQEKREPSKVSVGEGQGAVDVSAMLGMMGGGRAGREIGRAHV